MKPNKNRKQKEYWNSKEKEQFKKTIELYGNNYEKLQESLPTKTMKQIRSHLQYFNKNKNNEKEIKEKTNKKERNEMNEEEIKNQIFKIIEKRKTERFISTQNEIREYLKKIQNTSNKINKNKNDINFNINFHL